jgi:hypothetical protein
MDYVEQGDFVRFSTRGRIINGEAAFVCDGFVCVHSEEDRLHIVGTSAVLITEKRLQPPKVVSGDMVSTMLNKQFITAAVLEVDGDILRLKHGNDLLDRKFSEVAIAKKRPE